MTENSKLKWHTLLKYNTVAITASIVDYSFFLLLAQIAHVWYLLASFTGLVLGGVTAFLLERSWTFKRKDGKLSAQASRYLIAWTLSIFFNTTGLYLTVQYLGVQYIIAKVIVSIIIGIGFNFLMHKHFVFKIEIANRKNEN